MTRATERLNGHTIYGRGFFTSLFKFTEHAERTDNIPSGEYREGKIKEWCKDACDHLEELEIPDLFKNTRIEELIEQLKNLCYRCFPGSTDKDIDDAIHLTRLIGMELDRHFGIQPDIGRY